MWVEWLGAMGVQGKVLELFYGARSLRGPLLGLDN
jgi:hypothetical protein